MIVQLKGNVQFPITLDPTVWIFDDRKIKLEEAFLPDKEENHPERTSSLNSGSDHLSNEVSVDLKVKKCLKTVM